MPTRTTFLLIFLLGSLLFLAVSCKCFPPWKDCDNDPTPTPVVDPTPTPVPVPEHTILRVSGRVFTVNGKQTFLVGWSYYGALGEDLDVIKSDILWMKGKGFNWFRMWLVWMPEEGASAFNVDGTWHKKNQEKLYQMVKFCDENGIIVDVSGNYCSGTIDSCNKYPKQVMTSIPKSMAVWQNTTKLLKEFDNVYFDLFNEFQYHGIAPKISEIRQIVDAIKKIDPDRLVTCSGGHPNMFDYQAAGIDFLAPHGDRYPGWWQWTCPWLKNHPLEIPVHLQEPDRNGYGGSQYPWTDFCKDLKEAQTCDRAAAGWCFHTDAGFTMWKGEKFRDMLDPVEKEFINKMKTCLVEIDDDPDPDDPVTDIPLIKKDLNGWRSSAELKFKDFNLGGVRDKGYMECIVDGWTAPATGIDKCHMISLWEKQPYNHHAHPSSRSFAMWRIGANYNPFKFLATPAGLEGRVEAYGGSNSMVNDGKKHTYRIQWKGGKISYYFDGSLLWTYQFNSLGFEFVVIGTDEMYGYGIPDTPPRFHYIELGLLK